MMDKRPIAIVNNEEAFAPIIQKWDKDAGRLQVATSKVWKNESMSREQYYVIQTDIFVPPVAMDRIRQGHIPEQMEDHWFMFCEDDAIRYFRSWTGYNIYNGYFEKKDDGYHITKIEVDMVNYRTNPSRAVDDLKHFLHLLTAQCKYG